MILGIGTDMTEIARIEKVLADHDARFMERCFAPEERAAMEQRPRDQQAAGYAKRWAAKEAAAKALGRGIRDGIFLKDIVVTNDAAGRPLLEFRGGAEERLKAITPAEKKPDVHISLTDDRGLALAFVVISAL
jgi:holo-[acyl-carrier protein] synthase